MNTRTRSGQKNGGGGKGVAWIAVFAILTLGLALAAWKLIGDRYQNKVDLELGCLVNRLPPVAALFLVDATDQLGAIEAKRVVDQIKLVESKLDPYSRMIVVAFGDQTTSVPQPIFDRCMAPKAGLTVGERYVERIRKEFIDKVSQLETKLQQVPNSKSSPIGQQIINVASDPLLKWEGDRKRLILITDGLETQVYSSKRLTLKPAPENILKGVDAEYFEIGNTRSQSLQTPQLREAWGQWLVAAGAKVKITAPGYRAK